MDARGRTGASDVPRQRQATDRSGGERFGGSCDRVARLFHARSTETLWSEDILFARFAANLAARPREFDHLTTTFKVVVRGRP